METSKNFTLTVNEEKRQIVVTHLFDAPRALVFKVCTDPRLIPQWWGPRYLTTEVDQMDVRPGGVWRFVQRAPDGGEHAFNGVYKEITPPERVVQTFEYEGFPGHIILETTIFADQHGKTLVTAIDQFENLEDLQGMVQSGMESGAAESYERLAELIQGIQAKQA